MFVEQSLGGPSVEKTSTGGFQGGASLLGSRGLELCLKIYYLLQSVVK